MNPCLMSQNTQQMWQSILVQTPLLSANKQELFNHLDQFLAYLDEPMADSSALNFFTFTGN